MCRVRQHHHIEHLVNSCQQLRVLMSPLLLILACNCRMVAVHSARLHPLHSESPSFAISAPGIGDEARLHRPPFLLCEALTLIMPSEKLVRTNIPPMVVYLPALCTAHLVHQRQLLSYSRWHFGIT